MKLNVAASSVGFPYWLEQNGYAWLYKRQHPERVDRESYSDFIRANLMGGEPYQNNRWDEVPWSLRQLRNEDTQGGDDVSYEK